MKLIVNADDFGRSSEINRAVVRAHRQGILTSASLMAGGQAFEEAVAMARQNPNLAVGLHIVAVDGPAVLPRSRIPHLVDDRGLFPNDAVRAGMMYVLSAAARRELQAELRAQFERFAATGLKLSHVDGHQHMHLHPAVFNIVVPLARTFGARGLRIPRDDLALALKLDPRHASTKRIWSFLFGILSRWCALRLRGTGFDIPMRTYGFMQSGQMTEAYVQSVLGQLRTPTAEIYFHPSEGQRIDEFGPNPDDLQTLLRPAIGNLIRAKRVRLSTYLSLNGEAALC